MTSYARQKLRRQRSPGTPLVVVVVTALSIGCASKDIMVETDVPATVSFVRWGSLSTEGDVVGKTPIKVDLGKLGDKALRIESPGKVPYIWIKSTTIGQSVTASLKMVDLPKAAAAAEAAPEASASTTDLNKLQRLMMRAYKALFVKDLAVARDLATKAAELSPYTAMPLVIKGMAELEAGEKAAARLAFERAKSLDPGDAEVDELLKLTE